MHFRFLACVLVTLFAMLTAIATQPPAAPQAAPQPPATPDPRIAQLLEQWEKDATQTQSLWVRMRQTRTNPVFPNAPPEVKTGEAKFFKRPDGTTAARLDLNDTQNPNNFDRIIFTGSYIYQFRPQEKAVYIITVQSQQAGKTPDDGPLPFLFGMKAEVARKRYQFTVVDKPNPKDPDDKNWHTYLKVVPNFPLDQRDFSWAELAILKQNSQAIPKDMPHRIFYLEPNKVQVTWDILELQRNPVGKVAAIDFAKPEIPKGWRQELEQQVTPPSPGGQPRIIRNQSADKQ